MAVVEVVFIVPICLTVVLNIILCVGEARDFSRVRATSTLILPYQAILITISMLGRFGLLREFWLQVGQDLRARCASSSCLLLIGTQISMAPTLLLVSSLWSLGAERL